MTATITPIFGRGGGGGFDPLAFDLTRDKRAGARLLRRGDVLTHDTFRNRSFGDWRDHFAFATPRGCVGLSNYPEGLMLSTGEGAYDPASAWNSHGTYKNMAVLDDWDLVSVSGFIRLAGDGDLVAKKYPWETVEIGLDTQWPGSVRRSFFKAYLKDGIGGVAGQTGWLIRRHESGRDPQYTDVMIPGSEDVFTGGNERKWNWMYVRLTISRSANGGKGGYVELQVNDTIFDLQTLFGTVMSEDLILNNGSWDQFRYGLNPMFAITRSRLNQDYRYNVMVLRDAIVTVGDRRAA